MSVRKEHVLFFRKVFDVYIKSQPDSMIASDECLTVGAEYGIYNVGNQGGGSVENSPDEVDQE